MKFTIPEKIDLELLFNSDFLITYSKRVKRNKKLIAQEFTVPIRTLIKYIPYCYFFINEIVEAAINSIDGNPKLYVNISSKKFDNVIGQQNKEIARDILEQLGIMKYNKKYWTKNFSQSYRIEKEYLSIYREIDIPITLVSQGIIKREIESESNTIDLSGIIKRQISLNYGSDGNTGLVHNGKEIHGKGNILLPTCYDTSDLINRELRKKRNTYYAPIPYEVLDTYTFQLNNLFKLQISKDAEQFLNIENFQSIGLTAEQYIDTVAKANLLKDRKISFMYKNCRVYHTLNRTKREFRYYINAHGSQMIELDFKTSQIMHLIRLIDNDIAMGCINPSINLDLLKGQLYAFKRVFSQGDIYAHFANRYYQVHNKYLGRNAADSRQKAKDLVLERLINGGNKPRSNAHKWIRGLYPEITAFIDSYNCNGSKKVLANKLQGSEGYLLNEIIVNRIAQEFPDCILYTIFDSIIVEPLYCEIVHDIMMEESNKYFGFTTKIEQKEIKDPLSFHVLSTLFHTSR